MNRKNLIQSSKLAKLGKKQIIIKKTSKSKNQAVIRRINSSFSENFIEDEIQSQLKGVRGIKILSGTHKREIIMFNTDEEMTEAISKENINIGYERLEIRTKLNTKSEEKQ